MSKSEAIHLEVNHTATTYHELYPISVTAKPHRPRSSISSVEANVSVDAHESNSCITTTTVSGISSNFENEKFNEDMKLAIARSLKERSHSSANDCNVVTSSKPMKILRIVSNRTKGVKVKRQQPQADTACSSDLEPRKIAIDPDRMIPLTVQRAAIHVPQSSVLALEGGVSQSKKGKSVKSKPVEPVVRTFQEQKDTVRVSRIVQKRCGRNSRNSYYDITPEFHYLR